MARTRPDDAHAPRRSAGRGRRLAAALLDTGALLGAAGAALLVALAYLLARTEAGRLDVGADDAAVAWSLLGAVLPAWTAWQWAHLRGEGVTAGGARLGVPPRPSDEPGARGAAQQALRYFSGAVHPVTAPAWAWAALTLVLLEVPVLPAVAGFLAGVCVVRALWRAGVLVLRGPDRTRRVRTA